MKFTIIKEDNMVGIDGVFYTVDCSQLPEDFWAVQWTGPNDGVGGKGHIEFAGDPRPMNQDITDLGNLFDYYALWVDAKQKREEEILAAQNALKGSA